MLFDPFASEILEELPLLLVIVVLIAISSTGSERGNDEKCDDEMTAKNVAFQAFESAIVFILSFRMKNPLYTVRSSGGSSSRQAGVVLLS